MENQGDNGTQICEGAPAMQLCEFLVERFHFVGHLHKKNQEQWSARNIVKQLTPGSEYAFPSSFSNLWRWNIVLISSGINELL